MSSLRNNLTLEQQCKLILRSEELKKEGIKPSCRILAKGFRILLSTEIIDFL